MAGAREQVRVGFFPTTGPVGETGDAAAYLARAHDAGIDHVCCGDHVSFFVGVGLDGLLQATALTTLHPTLPVMTGVYLLPLRHPVLVARQVSDLDQLAPGRLVFGVGIGGEDRHEVEICGVDPRTRGRRMEESLTVLRRLLSGEATTFHGEFFDLDDALVLPPPARPVPIIVGGRSDAAARRAGRLGDGWLGIWNSARRFGDVVEMAGEEAVRAGRADPPSQHAMQMWCAIADTREQARARLAPAMEAFYQIPFERFEKYSPYGTAEDVAEFLVPYVDAGCSWFNLIPQADDRDAALAGAAAVKKLLARA
ncbi:MAG TPA: LLM class flavin-dependent oxidoreductase [Acidimicrobiia bacterium]|nr:LLM class flavin-dependent oxidoreductase [Acidimicrobiia bacterium]